MIKKNTDLHENCSTESKFQLRDQNYIDVLIQHGIHQARFKGPIELTGRQNTCTSAHNVFHFVSTHLSDRMKNELQIIEL
jgi:hypothetical protein